MYIYYYEKYLFYFQERTCGSEGCPGIQSLPGSSLSAQGRQILVGLWTIIALTAAFVGIFGTTSAPSPKPDGRSVAKDPRTLLGIPMGLFIGYQQGFILTTFIKV